MDGLGGLVVSPTRELALQIFDELRKVGQFHIFSAGLLIGGKDVKAEQEHIHGMLLPHSFLASGCNFKHAESIQTSMRSLCTRLHLTMNVTVFCYLCDET